MPKITPKRILSQIKIDFHPTNGFAYDITPEDHDKACRELRRWCRIKTDAARMMIHNYAMEQKDRITLEEHEKAIEDRRNDVNIIREEAAIEKAFSLYNEYYKLNHINAGKLSLDHAKRLRNNNPKFWDIVITWIEKINQ